MHLIVFGSFLAMNESIFRGPHKPVVLCIDDNAVALDLRKRVLEQGGFCVVTAGDAEEALSAFKTSPIDIVLSDHVLKSTTGVQIATQMKQLKPRVPVVLYSGAPPATMGPVDCFVLKTEPPEYLLSRLYDLVQRSRN
jgi:CheY-like chemotaxis protein